MTAHVQPSTYEAQLIEAHKARQARYEAAARKNARRPKIAPPVNLAGKTFVTKRMPIWQAQETHFDAHVWALVNWRINRTAKIRNYIRQRCIELCVSYTEITAGGQSLSLVPRRDRIVYEIKTSVDPLITWPALGKHFNRDHSSMITSFYRGAALAGDAEMAALVAHKRERAKERYRAQKARTK